MSTPDVVSQPSGKGPKPMRPKESGAVELKLYIARSTPNSVRAEQNLASALTALGPDGGTFILQVIDVFTNGRRAIVDNVIVTPTLIVTKGDKRHTIIGDLSESTQLHAILTD